MLVEAASSSAGRFSGESRRWVGRELVGGAVEAEEAAAAQVACRLESRIQVGGIQDPLACNSRSARAVGKETDMFQKIMPDDLVVASLVHKRERNVIDM